MTALPQSEIDAFIAEKFISVTDESKASPAYRPITSFDYVPITDKAQRAPFANFKTPSPIQAAAWPYLYAGRDVIGVAETGSGKTMGFGVPCVRYISSLSAKEQKKGIKACIVSPTRELAVQIQEQLIKLAEPAGLKAVCVYGGVNKDQQRATLTGAHIVVATPGRLNDFVSEGSIDLSNVTYAVLDEADRMLDKGFEEEVRKILGSCAPTGRQTLMFTATWPPSVRELAATFMKKPVRINIGENTTGELRANTRITQEVEVMDSYDKNDRLDSSQRSFSNGYQPQRGLSPDTTGTPVANQLTGAGSALGTGFKMPGDPNTYLQAGLLSLQGKCDTVPGMHQYTSSLWAKTTSPLRSTYSCTYDYGGDYVMQLPTERTNFVARGTFQLAPA
ncbi:MAG: DEAD/DEAH box helicase, partial [Proteobacteria bacterium]